jgi:hypothetical protein
MFTFALMGLISIIIQLLKLNEQNYIIGFIAITFDQLGGCAMFR